MPDETKSKLCDDAIVAIASGDRQPLEVLYDHMARDIYVTSLAITRNHADAEDALQDTMLQIVKYASSYRKGSNPRAWILTIARHRALDIVRRRKPTIPLDEISLADESSEVNGELALSLLDDLNSSERQLIIFRLYEELSYSEIAKIMKISTFAAQKRYQRALQKLKKKHIGKENFQ